jgi:hypothetical protein
LASHQDLPQVGGSAFVGLVLYPEYGDVKNDNPQRNQRHRDWRYGAWRFESA